MRARGRFRQRPELWACSTRTGAVATRGEIDKGGGGGTRAALSCANSTV